MSAQLHLGGLLLSHGAVSVVIGGASGGFVQTPFSALSGLARLEHFKKNPQLREFTPAHAAYANGSVGSPSRIW